MKYTKRDIIRLIYIIILVFIVEYRNLFDTNKFDFINIFKTEKAVL